VARAMRQHGPRVIVTSNLGVALEFVGQKEIRVMVTGGELSQQAPDLYGEWALQTLSMVQVDVSFFGCDAIDPAGEFYASDNRSAAVTRLMLENSQFSYLLADHSKFGRRAMCQVAKLRDLTGVVTDGGLPAEYRRLMEKAKINVLYAE
jgi:DeoR/GlpR family transcriptional regulator of sugar metabolism